MCKSGWRETVSHYQLTDSILEDLSCFELFACVVAHKIGTHTGIKTTLNFQVIPNGILMPLKFPRKVIRWAQQTNQSRVLSLQVINQPLEG